MSKGPPKNKDVIPQDLKNQWNSIRALATTITVIDGGSFNRLALSQVDLSLRFLLDLQAQAVESAKKHECAHMIPELKEFNKKEKDGAPKEA